MSVSAARQLTPRQRWDAAVAARPLEAPRALPAAFHSMASAITGRARPPMFTTGPATRSALAAAGALGATTGTTVHLSSVPSGPSVSAVLAHELAHTRNPVRRPRFLLGDGSGLLDDDERQALSAGQSAGNGVQQAGAGIVDSLPVGGGMGGGAMNNVTETATRVARAVVLEAAASPLGSGPAGMSGAAGAPGSAGLQGATGDAGSGGEQAATQAAGTTGGLVGSAGGTSGDGAGAAAALDPDKVVEIVEQRLLREIERRGGRWAGVF